jgi:protein transport protein SEC24
MGQKECGVPIAVSINYYGDPYFDGEPIPTISFGSNPIVRCKDCRAYVNPFIRFTDGGTRWIWNFWGCYNNVDNYYYSPLTGGVRNDIEERNELQYGSVDFLASADYMNRPPMAPTFLFVFDVSKSALDTGYLPIATGTIIKAIEADSIPGGERTVVGFLTYDDKVHYYNLKSTLKQPQMIVNTDDDHDFLPMPEDLMVNLMDSKDLILELLNQLPVMFSDSIEYDTNMDHVVKSIGILTKATGAKVFLFESSPISAKFPHLQVTQKPGVKDRPELIKSTIHLFKNYAVELSHHYVSIDQFALWSHNTFKNIATMSDLSRYTHGRFYYYPKFNSKLHGIKFDQEFYISLTGKAAWEAVGRIRVSGGYRQISTLGNYLVKARTHDLLSLPVCDENRVFFYELEKFEENQDGVRKKSPANYSTTMNTHIFVQTALLYTSAEGERRIRVHNLAMPFSDVVTEPYEHSDMSALASLYLKKGIDNLETLNPNFLSTRSYIEMWYSNMLSSIHRLYRNNAPETVDYLVWYCMGTLKNEVFNPSMNIQANAYVDQINSLRYHLRHMCWDEVMLAIWPQLFQVNDEQLSQEALPGLLNLSRSWLESTGIYILNNWFTVYLWIGSQVDSFFLDQLFGVQNFDELTTSEFSEEEIFFGEEQEAKAWVQELYAVIQTIKVSILIYPEFKILFEVDHKSEVILKELMLEDANKGIDFNSIKKQLTSQAAPLSMPY